MATAGYSGTPLLKKLGIMPSMKLKLVNAPEGYFDWLGADVRHQLAGPAELPDFIHVFAASNKAFESALKKLKSICKANPQVIIWVSWYKKSAGIPTDLTEDVIRNYALQHDLVDVKVCAVTEIWSGLKLVVPKAKRSILWQN